MMEWVREKQVEAMSALCQVGKCSLHFAHHVAQLDLGHFNMYMSYLFKDWTYF